MKLIPTVAVLLLALSSAIAEETNEKIISLEDPGFSCRTAVMTVGRDGKVYLLAGRIGGSHLLRMNPDGTAQLGVNMDSAPSNASANAAGWLISGHAHLVHKVVVRDPEFSVKASYHNFACSDQLGWDAPGHVEAGATDFYVLDQHRDQVLRFDSNCKIIREIKLPHVPSDGNGLVQDFKVDEAHSTLVFRTRQGKLHALDFDGKPLWEIPVSPCGRAYDFGPDGTLYVLPFPTDTIKRFGTDGKPLPDLKLSIANLKFDQKLPWFSELAIVKKSVLLRRQHETELFREFELESGAQKNVVNSRFERLAAHFPSTVWTAGAAMPFTLEYEVPGAVMQPKWRVWARPLEAPAYEEFKLHDGKLDVPATASGLYVIKISTSLSPELEHADSRRMLRAIVEIRKGDAKGTLAVGTPENRYFYGRGEAIPFEISARSAQKIDAIDAVAKLLNVAGVPIEQKSLSVKLGTAAKFTIPAELTRALMPGDYTVAVTADGWNCVPQRIKVGSGINDEALICMEYGDYSNQMPSGDFWTAPELANSSIARKQKLGVNMLVDRLGFQPDSLLKWNPHDVKNQFDPLVKKLTDDPMAVPPEKAHLLSPLLQGFAGAGSSGVREMSILLYNDAGLPLGTGFDPRKPEEMVAAFQKVTQMLAGFPAFRGWSWSSNWWVFSKRGGAAAATPEDKAAYEAAEKRANETGAWDPILDKVSSIRLGYAVEACELFEKAKKELAPSLISAVAAPVRNVEAYPPVTFSAVNEVDLQAQWEQMAIPFASALNVDFYKRPGKPAWAHPEIWNDSGTGDQIGPTLFQLLMRGADGIGSSGSIPHWVGAATDDPRSAHYSSTSVARAFYALVKPCGAMFQSLQNDDPVAIVLSGRMYRIDAWRSITGQHFARVFEAYMCCLYAGRPASLIFVEDLKPDLLKKFKALLLVDQRVELEPELAQALKSAQAAGVPVFYDGSCREELCKDFKPLGVKFTAFETDRSPAGDDGAYWRFPAYVMANQQALKETLGAAVPAIAEAPAGDVLLSRRRGGSGEYLFVVQNSVPEFEPGQLWRVNLNVSCRVPMVVPVQINTEGKAMYDVFAQKLITPEHGTINADLRTLPARVYAILPKPIDHVKLSAAAEIRARQSFEWSAAVASADGQNIAAHVPVRVRLTDSKGTMLEERFVTTTGEPAHGTFVAPITIADGLTLEATELFSGRAARLPIKGVPAELPIAFADSLPVVPPAPAATTVTGKEASDSTPGELLFGPHLREAAVSADGKSALISAMNWDHNLYALNLDNGSVAWRSRIGNYFAFSPRTAGNGFVAEGFDMKSAEGYFQYQLSAAGKLERRFALYGLPKRLPFRFVPGILHDRIDNFATAPDGSWTAAAGDLGIAVWKSSGDLLWSDEWWKTDRHTLRLLALDTQTLLTLNGMRVRAVDATNGKSRWELTLGSGGEPLDVCATPDGKTCAVLTTHDGGSAYVLRDGKVVRTFATGSRRVELSTDGKLLLTFDSEVECYSLENGLQWTFTGDDLIHQLHIAPDGQRIAAASDLGTLYILGANGAVLHQQDCGARTEPTWLADGGLLLSTWMGKVVRLDNQYKPRWTTHVEPAALSMRGHQLDDDGAPTTRPPFAGTAEAKPLPLTPNLLSQTTTGIRLSPGLTFANDAKLLTDGKTDPPPGPWIDWSYVGFFAETMRFNYLLIDTNAARLRVDAITFVEDAAHPESWLRDAYVECWDPQKEQWTFGAQLLSNAQIHSHKFAHPLEGSRFRIVLPWGCVGNLRLAELIFHGELAGAAHPDVAAKKPVAVLFDEGAEFQDSLIGNGLEFCFDHAYSGSRCLHLRGNDSIVAARYQPPFGHAIPLWNFDIAEKPEPGQYRYLQFTWKAESKATTGAMLQLYADANPIFHAGELPRTADNKKSTAQVSPTVPPEWTSVRVDLFEVMKKPGRIWSLALGCKGGGMYIDQIVLGRSEQDLPPMAGGSTKTSLAPKPEQAQKTKIKK